MRERIGAGPYTNAFGGARGKRGRVRITADHPLVLGSASPRRRELALLLGVPFVVQSAAADETPLPGERPRDYVERVTRAKLEAVRAMDLGSAGGVLVADTIVVAPDGALLGKPLDDVDGRAMIERLAGKTHEVSTRFALAPILERGSPEPATRNDPAAAALHAQTVTTRVTFRSLTRGEVLAYVSSGEGRDKAGGYAVQGAAGLFVERIEGSFTSVVGLPLCEVLVAMRSLGWVGS
jgi:septum formation protein